MNYWSIEEIPNSPEYNECKISCCKKTFCSMGILDQTWKEIIDKFESQPSWLERMCKDPTRVIGNIEILACIWDLHMIATYACIMCTALVHALINYQKKKLSVE